MKVLYSTRRLALALVLSLLAGAQLWATTCAQAVVVSSLPYSAAVVCSGTNDITSTNSAVCAPASASYYGGQEALLTYTPATSQEVLIEYSGQTWTAIVVWAGCPTSGGTCVGGFSSSTAAKSLTVNLNAGTQYYIMIDTWPSPPSPCPGTVTITSAGAPPPPPDNDSCADAAPISCGQTVMGTTTNATSDNAGFCGTSNTSPGVWYTFTGVGRNARVSTCNPGTNFDTKISVFAGSCSGLVCVGGNDDASGCGLQSRFEFITEPGAQYYVLVHGFGSATGNFSLSLECGLPVPPPVLGCTDPAATNYNPNATQDDGSCVYPPPPPPVPNDLCANATLIGCGQTMSGSTLNATGTGQPTAFCGTTPGSFGVWYRYVGTGEIVTVSTCNPGTDFDTKLNVYSGSCASLVCVGGNDDTTDPSCQLPNGLNRKSRVIFTSTAGTTYYILVTGFSSLRGNFELSISCAPAIIPGCTDPNAVNYNPNATVDNGSCIYPPANDACANAAPISCGQTLSGTTTGASFDDVGTCGTSNTSPGVWYTFLGAGRSAILSTCNQASFDTKISVFSGSCGNLVCVGGNDDAPGCAGFTSSVTVPTAPGARYYVLVHGFGSATGNFSLSLTCGVNPIAQQDPGQTIATGRIALFPNPAQDVVNVKVGDFMGRTAIATVFNNVGQMVVQRNLGEIQIPTERIELGNLAAGMYYLTLNVEGELFTEKFIVNGNRP